MRGFAFGTQCPSDDTSVGNHNIQFCRFGDDRQIRSWKRGGRLLSYRKWLVGPIGDKTSSSQLLMLFITGETRQDRRPIRRLVQCVNRHQDGRHPPFDITGSSPPNSPFAHFPAKWLHGHMIDRDGILMCIKQNDGASGLTRKHRQQILSPRLHLLKFVGNGATFKKINEVLRHPFLNSDGTIFLVPHRIHTGDLDQLPCNLHHIQRHARIPVATRPATSVSRKSLPACR